MLKMLGLITNNNNNNNNNSELGRRLVSTGRGWDVRSSSFLFERVSAVVQRFNSVSCMMVLLLTADQSRVYTVKQFVFLSVNFEPPGVFPWKK